MAAPICISWAFGALSQKRGIDLIGPGAAFQRASLAADADNLINFLMNLRPKSAVRDAAIVPKLASWRWIATHSARLWLLKIWTSVLSLVSSLTVRLAGPVHQFHDRPRSASAMGSDARASSSITTRAPAGVGLPMEPSVPG